MKVEIGDWPDRWVCKLSRNWLEFRYGETYYWTGEQGTTRVDRIIEGLDDLLQSLYDLTINRILDKRTRKVKVKLDPWDAWSADHTLAYIILPILRELKEKKQGAPYVELDDVPEHLRPGGLADEYGVDATHFERWDWVMDEMIFAFENKVNDDWEDQFNSGEWDMKSVPVDVHGNEVTPGESKYTTWVPGPNHTYEVDREARDAHCNRMQNGFILFGKYYQCLWN